jgi:hypothetical protein
MDKRLKYIQVAGDALIPILGYFLWNWSLYFIILFYLIDLVISEVIVWLKSKKIRAYSGISYDTFKSGIKSGILMLLAVLVIHLGILTMHPEIHFFHELVAFWQYKDMGVQQGYILLPLLVLVAYQRYKMEFLLTAKFRAINEIELWRGHQRSHLYLIGASAFAAGLISIVSIPEPFLLGAVIVGISGYNLFLSDN